MDIRNTIINNVLLAVQSLLDDQQLQAVQDALCIQLNSYEVQERSTELTVVDNAPDSMLAKYIATKRIEGKAESTIKRYYDTCYMMIHEICKPLHEITTYDLRYYLAVYKEQRKISNRTLDGMRRCFSSFFLLAFCRGADWEESMCSTVPNQIYESSEKALHGYRNGTVKAGLHINPESCADRIPLCFRLQSL